MRKFIYLAHIRHDIAYIEYSQSIYARSKGATFTCIEYNLSIFEDNSKKWIVVQEECKIKNGGVY